MGWEGAGNKAGTRVGCDPTSIGSRVYSSRFQEFLKTHIGIIIPEWDFFQDAGGGGGGRVIGIRECGKGS